MPRETIKQILMRRDGLDPEDADNLISEAREEFNQRLSEGDMPFDLCQEWFGLEPDWLDEFMY